MAIREHILHNFWWKLLSLLLAALTWLTIETASRKEEQLHETPVVMGASSRSFPSVPVMLLTSAANAGQFTVTPHTVSVEVSGKPEDLEKVQLQDIRAYVDVTETDDEIKFGKTVQVRMPGDFKTSAVPPVASVERINNVK